MGWVLLLLFAFSANAAPLAQIQSFNCDIDDNILFSPAPIMLWDAEHLKEVAVSTTEWALMRGELGKGKWKNFSLRPGGLRFFGDTSAEGEDLFKNQIVKMIRSKNDTWKGPSWNAFVAAMSNPETRKHTTLITARMHSPKSIWRGLKVLYDRGLLPALPPAENIYPVAWPDFPKELQGADHSESKANVMIKLLDAIEAVPVPRKAMLVENAQGTGKERLHLWGFSDDDMGNFKKALDVLAPHVAADRWPHIKIVLYFTGIHHPTIKPHSLVIRPDGSTRPVMPTEATRMGLPKKISEYSPASLDALYAQCIRDRSGFTY